MKKRKTLFSILMAFTMIFTLAGCASGPSDENKDTASAEPESVSEDTQKETEESSASEETENTAGNGNVLVAYFSATGTTKGVAEKIAALTGGDLYEILPTEPYSADDLNYNDSSTRATTEQNDKDFRPEIGSEDISLEGYTTIYLGYPIWWGEEPRIMDAFAEKYSFEGITVIPFCTSGSSSIGRSSANLKAIATGGTWLEGSRFEGNVTEEELQSWIESLK